MLLCRHRVQTDEIKFAKLYVSCADVIPMLWKNLL